MPFARIAREWDSEDQTVPTAVFVRRAEDGSLPIVKAMTLDMGFSAIDPGKQVLLSPIRCLHLTYVHQARPSDFQSRGLD